uniref:TauD/TfdA-like domain-containing protein n=1 Tax=Timema douglasi TaxID=61478 RepID=A0A7R8ZCD1_TIMDO|nr:unnamed protein product [Timema douglasi]
MLTTNLRLFRSLSRMASFYKLTPLKIGCEVQGVDLRTENRPEVIAQIKKDVTEHRILVFKDQGIISGDRHVEISRWFGELESTFYKHPRSPHPDVFRVSNDASEGCTGVGRTGWHIDGSFQSAPFSYSLYHMVSVPKRGATAFAPLTELIEGLSPERRAEWKRLWMMSDRRSGPLHPLIYPHPHTGKKRHINIIIIIIIIIITTITSSHQDKVNTSTWCPNLRRQSIATEGYKGRRGATLYPVCGACAKGSPIACSLSSAVGVMHLTVVVTGSSTVKSMKRNRVEQRVLIVCTYWKSVSIKACQRHFKAQFGTLKPPATSSVQYLVMCFHTGMVSGYVWDKGTKRERYATDDEFNRINQDIEDEFKKDGGKIQYVHQWSEGEFIISDNLAVGHEATPETQLPRSKVGLRVLHRTTIKGTHPPDSLRSH